MAHSSQNTLLLPITLLIYLLATLANLGMTCQQQTLTLLIQFYAPSRVCALKEIFVGFTQSCLRVVSWWSVDIPLVVWGLCFGKVGWVISCLVGSVRGIVGRGHSVPRPTPVSVSSINAAIIYVPGG